MHCTPPVDKSQTSAALRKYTPLCRAVVAKYGHLARTVCGPVIDEDDMMLEARLAVVDALANYTRHDIPEPVWVRTRVRQRILDLIRRFNVRTRDEILALRDTSDESLKRALIGARRFRSLDMDNDTGTFPLPSAEASPEDTAVRNAQLDLLYRAIACLPERQRLAVELGLLQDKPLAEVAAAMGVTESRVSQLQQRAMRNIKRTSFIAAEVL